MWNPFHASPPWLLRFFDQIRFYEVSAQELLEIREDFPYGGYPLRFEEQEFRLKDYHAFLGSIRGESAEFKGRQQAAFEAERERWALAGADRFVPAPGDDAVAVAPVDAVPDGSHPVCPPGPPSVWDIPREAGTRGQAGHRWVVAR